MNLAKYHGKYITIKFNHTTLDGMISYKNDVELGPILMVPIEGLGDPVFMLSEEVVEGFEKVGDSFYLELV